MISESHGYSGKKVFLATKHSKGRAISPEFQSILDMQVEEIYVDTDLLGTFSGEIERKGSARETVLAKARMAIAETGNPYALASEGSIGADPFIPFINSDFELLAFVDDNLGFEIVESIRSAEIVAVTIKVTPESDLSEFLRKADFPNHRLIIKTAESPTTFSVKGIGDLQTLEESLREGFGKYPELIVESDLRAHYSPSRMANIALAARKLALRLSNCCPECQTPGWGIVSYSKGLACSDCGEVSEDALKSEVLGCAKCSFKTQGVILAEEIDPSRCNYCNP